jgi:hypothetical protein
MFPEPAGVKLVPIGSFPYAAGTRHWSPERTFSSREASMSGSIVVRYASGMSYELLIGPLIGAVATIAAAWIGVRYRQVVGAEATPTPPETADIWVPQSVTTPTGADDRSRRLPRERPGAPGRIRGVSSAAPRLIAAIWRFMNELPPVNRRTRPGAAAAVSWLPFVPAAYFRTPADFVFSIALVVPMTIAGGAIPDTEAKNTGAHTPLWASVAMYTCLLAGVLYGYLRALTSNRMIELAWVARRAAANHPAEGIPEERTTDDRKRELDERLEELAGEGWLPARRGEFEAVVERRPKVNHLRNAILTAITFGLWAPVWIYRAFLNREERDVDVDPWGIVHDAVPGSPQGAEAAPA